RMAERYDGRGRVLGVERSLAPGRARLARDRGGRAGMAGDDTVVPPRGADAVRVRLLPVPARDGCELSRRGIRDLAGSGEAWARAAGPRARSGAAGAARADRSALSLQQPAVDQRADDEGSGSGAADVPAPGRFPARHAVARLARAHHAHRRARPGAAVSR